MNSEWQTFLTAQQATIQDGYVHNFGDESGELASAESGTVIADLSYLGVIAAHGSDTETFLQGQFSNDVRLVTPELSQITAYCNPKGRMLAGMRVFRRNDHYYLSLPHSLLDPTLKRLRMFILRSDVTLDDASDEMARMGIAGPEAEALLAKQISDLPKEPDQVVQHDELSVIRINGIQPRFEIHGPAEPLQALWESLKEQAQPVGYAAWNWLDIMAGVPMILPENLEAFVPQMVNLHSLGGISFKKGCYTGQEVVARMHYLGKLKRRMYRAHVDVDTPPAPGDDLFPDGDGSSSAGKVVTAQSSPDGGVDLLAVLQINNVDAGPIHLGSSDGPQLQFEDLPYSVALEAS